MQTRRQSKTSIILKMALAGDTPANIAATMDMAPTCVRSIISRLRAKGHNIPHSRAGRVLGASISLDVRVSSGLRARLQHEAEVRKMSTRDLATMIVTAALADDMVTAILDDLD